MKWVLRHQEKVFPVLDIALNGINYLFNIYIAWHLVPGDFGIVTALLSLLSLLLVAGVSLQLYTAKQVAEEADGGTYVREHRVASIRRSARRLTAAVTVVYLAALVPLHGLTRGSYLALGLVLAVFLLNAFLSIDRGVLQGSRRFLQLNLNFYLEVGVKVAAVAWLLRVLPSIESVLLAIAVGMAAALAHARLATRSTASEVPATERHHRSGDLPRIAKIYVATFFTYFFTSVDLIIVNYFLPDQSGYFAVVLKYTQVLLFVTLSLMTVFIPVLSAAKSDPQLFRRKLLQLLGLVVAVISVITATYAVAAGPTVDWFFGTQYGAAKGYILLDCLPYALLILNFLVINVHVIFDQVRYLWVLLSGAFLLVGLLLAFHGALSTMLWIESAVFGAMLVAQLLLLRRKSFLTMTAPPDDAALLGRGSPSRVQQG